MERLDAVDDEQRPDRGIGVVGIEHELHVGAGHGEGHRHVAFAPHLGEAEAVAVEAQRCAQVGGRNEAAQAAKILAGALARDISARPDERREAEEYPAELRQRLTD